MPASYLQRWVTRMLAAGLPPGAGEWLGGMRRNRGRWRVSCGGRAPCRRREPPVSNGHPATSRHVDPRQGGYARPGVQRAAPQLSAGAYVWHLGAQRFQFEVPAEAVVQLSGRTLKSGTYVAVFTAADGTELIVDPTTLPARGRPAACPPRSAPCRGGRRSGRACGRPARR